MSTTKLYANEGAMQVTLEEVEQRLQGGVEAALARVQNAEPLPESFKPQIDKLCQYTLTLLGRLSPERGGDDRVFEQASELLSQYQQLIELVSRRADLSPAISQILPTYRTHIQERLTKVQNMIDDRRAWRNIYQKFIERELLTPQQARVQPVEFTNLLLVSEALQGYREGIETLFELKSEKPVPNADPDHAAILYEAFFRHAKDQVFIFCERLRERTWDKPPLIAEAKKALQRGVKIKVLTQEPEERWEAKDFLSTLKAGATLTNKVGISRATSQAVQNAPYNFTVMDEVAFRYEPDRDNPKAVAILHSPDMAKQLLGKFSSFESK